MSHFSVAVIHNKEQDIEELLAPYEEIDDNPNSKWDWYEVGGRWDSISAKLKNVDFNNFSTYAVVTPDGVWHEKGNLDYREFLISGTPEMDYSWKKNFSKNFLENSDQELILTVVDCHI